MSKLPRLSGRDCVRALSKHKELDRGTLRAILRQANLSIDEFNMLRTKKPTSAS